MVREKIKEREGEIGIEKKKEGDSKGEKGRATERVNVRRGDGK